MPSSTVEDIDWWPQGRDSKLTGRAWRSLNARNAELQLARRLLDDRLQLLEVVAGVGPRFAGVHNLLGFTEADVEDSACDLDRFDRRESVRAELSEDGVPVAAVGIARLCALCLAHGSSEW